VKRHAPAATRNAPLLLAAAARLLPPPAPARLLELGSGPGEHAVALARALPHVTVQPSDPDPEARASAAAWAGEAALPNLRAPLNYDLRLPIWHAPPADLVLCVNVLHAARPACGPALLLGAGRALAPGGRLLLYGPFTRGGAAPAGRLARLDGTLRAADPALGVRDLDALLALAARHGLRVEEIVPGAEHGDLLIVIGRSG
jgi:SAM-dependent methyltransferase